MKSLWKWFKWLMGLDSGELVTWWEGMDFYVKYQDRLTGQTLRLFKCTCRIAPVDPDSEPEL